MEAVQQPRTAAGHPQTQLLQVQQTATRFQNSFAGAFGKQVPSRATHRLLALVFAILRPRHVNDQPLTVHKLPGEPPVSLPCLPVAQGLVEVCQLEYGDPIHCNRHFAVGLGFIKAEQFCE